jgi:hypothetical protein
MDREKQISGKADIDTVLGEVLAGAGDQAHCLSLPALSDLAEGAVNRRQRKVLTAHLRRCPACASLLAELRAQAAPVRSLHQDWLGWKGVLLKAWGQLPEAELTESAWNHHYLRCPSCQPKAALLARIASACTAPWRSAVGQLPGFASGALAVLLLVLLMPSSNEKTVPAPAPTPAAGPLEKGPEKGPKKGPEKGSDIHRDEGKRGPKQDPVAADTPVEPTMAQLVDPSPQHLTAAISFWEEVVAGKPTDIAALEKLQELYGRQVTLYPDDASNQIWSERLHEIREQLVTVRTKIYRQEQP